MSRFYWKAAGAGLALLAGCVEPYAPKAITSAPSYVVVDGFINARGVSTIRLSRTTSLADAQTPPPETRAQVFVEEEGGARYPLTEATPGTYTSAPLSLGAGRRVRLYFKTTGPREYASDFVPVKLTPAIDSVSWRPDARGLNLYVSTHDASEQARFYRWECEETYAFTSGRQVLFRYQNNQLLPRYDNIFNCWRSEKGTDIKLNNTRSLSRDVLVEAPLLKIPLSAEKLRIKYSILVRQFAQTEQEYAYWQELAKNTENLGTIFGPMPGQTTGNVHNLGNRDEQVIGYVGAQSVTERRIFIDRTELPDTWRMVTPYDNCTRYDTIPNPESGTPHPLDHFRSGQYLPVDQLPGGFFWLSSSPECVDCRLRGTNVKPSFWP